MTQKQQVVVDGMQSLDLNGATNVPAAPAENAKDQQKTKKKAPVASEGVTPVIWLSSGNGDSSVQMHQKQLKEAPEFIQYRIDMFDALKKDYDAELAGNLVLKH